MVRPASAIRPFGPAAFALQGFFRSLPAGRRRGARQSPKKLSHKSGVRRGKAILQFFRPPPTAADFDGRATEGLGNLQGTRTSGHGMPGKRYFMVICAYLFQKRE